MVSAQPGLPCPASRCALHPADTNVTCEVDKPERVGLAVSVLHLPPGATMHAAFVKDGLVHERRDGGERSAPV